MSFLIVVSFAKNILSAFIASSLLWRIIVKLEHVLTSETWMQLARRMIFYSWSLMSWLTILVVSNKCLLWMVCLGITKLRCIKMMKNTVSFRIQGYTITPYALWLKNVTATYQRAMNTIFYNHLCKTVEWYVDDIII